MRDLEGKYLEHADAQAQSGFAGGRLRWVSERSPLLEAVDRSGSFIDVGCANGLLAADVVEWSGARGFEIDPYGIDLGTELINLARHRLPLHAGNFVAVDAWAFEPGRRWSYVYSLLDLSPRDMWCDWLVHLASWVEAGGRLIIGSYGSRSRLASPVDVEQVMKDCGLPALGSSSGGQPPISRFAWIEPN